MWPRVVVRREAVPVRGRNEDDGVLSGPLGDSSERDGREHLAREHLANVPHGGVREAPPPIFTVFGKIPGGLFSAWAKSKRRACTPTLINAHNQFGRPVRSASEG